LAVEIGRQAIERHDFPLSRRGYDPASVDAHLREIANRVEELARQPAGSAPTLAAAAGTQVQSIIATAESAAADIRREATADAARTREDSIAEARAHVAAVGAAATALRERVAAVTDALGSFSAKAQSAAERLVRDLEQLERGVSELYDSAHAPSRPADAEAGDGKDQAFPIPSEVPGSAPRAHANPLAGTHDRPQTAAAPAAAVPSQPGPPPDDGDADSARLVALNMALSGESRADTERYLAENFRLSDPLKLVDEVYAAIEA
jgi:DivIVA domain-containing protein